MLIPTEPIGSIPRPAALISAWADKQAGRLSVEQFSQIADAALRDTIRRFEETDSPIITDGEQTKSSFATYPLDGASSLAMDGVVIPFEDGHTLENVREHRQPDQIVFVGVTDPINPTVETPEQVLDRVLLAAKYLPVSALGTTDDCGFAPFADDASTSREIAFEKIRARVVGTRIAARELVGQ